MFSELKTSCWKTKTWDEKGDTDN